jgi:hypothetical protein
VTGNKSMAHESKLENNINEMLIEYQWRENNRKPAKYGVS